MIKFSVPMKAVAKERPRVTRYGTYTPIRTANFEKLFGLYSLKAMAGRKPFDQPIAVTLTFWFKRPKKPVYDIPTKSDLDNLMKSVLDSLNKICWTDDRFIYRITAGKYFTLERNDDYIEVQIDEESTQYRISNPSVSRRADR